MAGFIKIIGNRISKCTSTFKRSQVTKQQNYLNDV